MRTSPFDTSPRACIGALKCLSSDRATKEEMVTAIARTKPNSRNRRPAALGRKEIGMKTETRVTVGRFQDCSRHPTRNPSMEQSGHIPWGSNGTMYKKHGLSREILARHEAIPIICWRAIRRAVRRELLERDSGVRRVLRSTVRRDGSTFQRLYRRGKLSRRQFPYQPRRVPIPYYAAKKAPRCCSLRRSPSGSLTPSGNDAHLSANTDSRMSPIYSATSR